ncbi:MAG: hypothetical protein JWR02_2189 [Mucilaginibacter sp.]|nr:hypothetical protein [Mucilaginibacter sp.]
MEDIKAYIESGILELYVLGDVTQEEKLQVEDMALKHPAIKAELDEIERSMELYAESNSVGPPAHLRDRVLNSVLTNFADDRNFDTKKGSEAPDNTVVLSAQRSYNFYKYAFAACLTLLLASSIALIALYNQLQQSNNQLAVLQTDKQHFANRVNLMDHELSVFRNPSFKFMKLKGTVRAPSAVLMVAWNPVNKKVMIDMGSMKMPVNDKDHQYQLWALVGKKPVGLGVFDMKADSTDMKEMKSIASANAFAVTLEPRGGSATPTMDQMMVIGQF